MFESFCDRFNRVLDQPHDVAAGEDVVSILVVDLVHHRVDDQRA